MQDNPTQGHPMDPEAIRISGMQRDLEFISRLLGAPIYHGKSPNLFERLQEYRTEADGLKEAMEGIDTTKPGAVAEFEKRLYQWKHRVYEFIESNI